MHTVQTKNAKGNSQYQIQTNWAKKTESVTNIDHQLDSIEYVCCIALNNLTIELLQSDSYSSILHTIIAHPHPHQGILIFSGPNLNNLKVEFEDFKI